MSMLVGAKQYNEFIDVFMLICSDLEESRRGIQLQKSTTVLSSGWINEVKIERDRSEW